MYEIIIRGILLSGCVHLTYILSYWSSHNIFIAGSIFKWFMQLVNNVSYQGSSNIDLILINYMYWFWSLCDTCSDFFYLKTFNLELNHVNQVKQTDISVSQCVCVCVCVCLCVSLIELFNVVKGGSWFVAPPWVVGTHSIRGCIGCHYLRLINH